MKVIQVGDWKGLLPYDDFPTWERDQIRQIRTELFRDCSSKSKLNKDRRASVFQRRGAQLEQIGGLRLMQRIYYDLHDLLGSRVENLQQEWDGIGEWGA